MRNRAATITRTFAFGLGLTWAAGCGAQLTTAPAASATPPAAPAAAVVPQRVVVKVADEGFVPARIATRKGVPLTLVITREVGRTCATEILFEGETAGTKLPLGKTVEVTYTPRRTGEIRFGCAMGMMVGGVLVVEDVPAAPAPSVAP